MSLIIELIAGGYLQIKLSNWMHIAGPQAAAHDGDVRKTIGNLREQGEQQRCIGQGSGTDQVYL